MHRLCIGLLASSRAAPAPGRGGWARHSRGSPAHPPGEVAQTAAPHARVVGMSPGQGWSVFLTAPYCRASAFAITSIE